MHGRPRPEKGKTPDPKDVQKKKRKTALYAQLAAVVLSRRAEKRYDAETLTASAELLKVNPEVYTVWNYRREALADVIDGSGSDACREAVRRELELTQAVLAVNPKSYAAWHHRTWVVTEGAADLQQELALVTRLLEVDSRNFHGWAYWRWLTGRAGTPPEEHLHFVDDKLTKTPDSFSNYSAWHARTHLLAAVHAKPRVQTLDELMAGPSTGTALPSSLPVPMHVLDREFELVHRAFWVAPQDQSAWLYHRWLLGSCMAAAGVTSSAAAASGGNGSNWASQAEAGSSAAVPAEPESRLEAREALRARLQAEADQCEALLQEEPDAKWPLLTLTRVQELQEAVEGAAPAPPSAAGDSAGVSTSDDHSLMTDRYKQLAELDPKRAGYYADAAAGRAHVVLKAPLAS